MKEQGVSIWQKLSASFWFIPALATVGIFALFAVTEYLDQVFFADLAGLPILFSGGASAARDVLAAIAGSLITVIGTAFSLTIVTFTLISGQYTPRFLKSLAADRGLQVVLGAYIATFVYALLVLRIIRSPTGNGEAFIPVTSVTTAVVLALCCVALLIYFIYHVINLIQPSTIFQRIHAEMMKPISTLDDRNEPQKADSMDRPESVPDGDPYVVRAERSGYVQYFDVDAVVDAVAAGGETKFVEVPFVPGNFVAAGLPIVRAWPAPKGGLSREAEVKARREIVFGKERTIREDFTFGLRQLTDIALKGLSPSVNDPTTAMQAMDRTEAILIALGEKELPRRLQERNVDGAGVLVRIGYTDFDGVAEVAFDQVRRAAFATGQVVFLKRYLEVSARALRANASPERQRALWTQALAVARLAPEQLPDPRDATDLILRVVGIGAFLTKTGLRSEVDADLEELAKISRSLPDGERIHAAVHDARTGPN